MLKGRYLAKPPVVFEAHSKKGIYAFYWESTVNMGGKNPNHKIKNNQPKNHIPGRT